MRVKYTALTAAIVTGLLAPAAHANHQFGDGLIDSDGARDGGTVTVQPAAPLERAGFDWADAAVGAGFALGSALLLIGLALVGLRTRVRTGTTA